MANRENFISEGDSIFLDLAATTSGGDIDAGDMVCLSLLNLAKNTGCIHALTGITSSQFFIGVAEHFLSGGKTGLTIKTKGVFAFTMADTAGTGYIGDPVLGADAQTVAPILLCADSSGLPSIGNVIAMKNSPAACSLNTGCEVWVRINPPALRNWFYGGTCTADAGHGLTATYQHQFPPLGTGIIYSGT